MEYTKEVDIANKEDEYAIGNDGNNKPLAEGNNDDNNNKYASTARCAESIILSATPTESMNSQPLLRVSCSQRRLLRV